MPKLSVCLLHLHALKSLWPNGIHPRLIKVLADVIVRSLSIIFQCSWESGGVLVYWKLTNIIHFFFRRIKKKALLITGLSVSIWCLAKIWVR